MGSMEKNKRKIGTFGETLAAKEMEKMGYTILDRNYTKRGGEIDIIAKKGNCIVFAEVKFRKSTAYGLPKEAVTGTKQKKIIQTAKAYIFEKELIDWDFRFDVAEVLQQEGKYYFHYMENAFWEE